MAFLQILIITPSFLNPPAPIGSQENTINLASGETGKTPWLDGSPDSTETGSPLVQIVFVGQSPIVDKFA